MQVSEAFVSHTWDMAWKLLHCSLFYCYSGSLSNVNIWKICYISVSYFKTTIIVCFSSSGNSQPCLPLKELITLIKDWYVGGIYIQHGIEGTQDLHNPHVQAWINSKVNSGADPRPVLLLFPLFVSSSNGNRHFPVLSPSASSTIQIHSL